MKFKIHIYYIICAGMTILCSLLASCRGDELLILPEETDLGQMQEKSSARGMYVLNQGNMGSNKCTLDYLDLTPENATAHYYENIFPQRNPNEIKELGDVGNDLKIYDNKLWMVINCSNKVEVCNASDARKIGKIDIPNCRYLTFADGYAYVSSYVGPVVVSGDAPLGRVYKIDAKTLQKVDSITVGYQPEEMAVIDDCLYVVNSGGYRAPQYDNRLTVISLGLFKVIDHVEIAPNLSRCRADKYGRLWIATHGDNVMDIAGDSLFVYKDENTRLFCIDPLVRKTEEIRLESGKGFSLIDVFSHQPISTAIFSAPEINNIEKVYGVKINPETHDFYIMDAKNYVSSGELLHFHPDGRFDWRVWTGDIPCAAAFCYQQTELPGEGSAAEFDSRYIQAVDEYLPAPGQFINKMPVASADDTNETMLKKCTDLLANNRRGTVSLGAFGGYITFHFDHSVQNVPDEYDFLIRGNAILGGAEPGIVMVAQDLNGNGLPDDPWFELSGSADVDSIGKVCYNHSETYRRKDYPATFPRWISDEEITFTGTILPQNAVNVSATAENWVLSALRYGYADNLPNNNREGNSFKIDWAVDSQRQSVHLSHIDFIRVYTAVQQYCGWIGETSTEITGAEDLHYGNFIKQIY